MANNELGTPRRSHCVGNLGPGAIGEFRVGKNNGAAISVVIGGMDYWDTMAPPAGIQNDQVTFERRLQKFLKVQGFRLPPVDPDRDWKKGKNITPLTLAAVRFPMWLQCPRCSLLKTASQWQDGGTPGDPTRKCGECTKKAGRDLYVMPARFVVACTNGHLQEFPWDKWLTHKAGCSRSKLKLSQSKRAGLAGLILECLTCKASKSMEAALGKETMKVLRETCAGERPWLGPGAAEPCDPDNWPRAVQRGASNLYYAVTASALSIPPFTESAQSKLDEDWSKFDESAESDWPTIIRIFNLETKLNMTAAEILKEAKRSKDALSASTVDQIRWEEYSKLCSEPQLGEETSFEIRSESVPPKLKQYFDKVVRVVRLREVRALRGFTRILPPAGEFEEDAGNMAKIYKERKNWLPAIEVKGEGIFLRFNEEELKRWEQKAGKELTERASAVNKAYTEAWKERQGEGKAPPRRITHRFLLAHSFAHALMRRLTLSCGYSNASLRERLYVGENMTGLLVYTGTTDSDGSLGGLERQGKPDRINELVPAAIRDMEWCSNDPLCIEDVSTFSDAQNLAACHSCMMAPETSCEEFNLLLDRAMLVGKPANPKLGYFAAMLNPLSAI